jgi:hypothetical protein
MGWNPWRHIGHYYPHVIVDTDRELPARMWGLQSGHRIWLCRRLNQVRRRCTLTHEIVHLERGPVPADPAGLAREERVVSQLAARRLIPIDQLTAALAWTRDPHQLADELWVDLPTLYARMGALDAVEVAELEHRLDGQWLWIP